MRARHKDRGTKMALIGPSRRLSHSGHVRCSSIRTSAGPFPAWNSPWRGWGHPMAKAYMRMPRPLPPASKRHCCRRALRVVAADAPRRSRRGAGRASPCVGSHACAFSPRVGRLNQCTKLCTASAPIFADVINRCERRGVWSEWQDLNLRSPRPERGTRLTE
jgi:hypothetical protein